MSLRIPYDNITLEDMNITPTLDDTSFMDMYKISVYGFAIIITLFIIATAYNIQFNQIKDQIIIPNLNKWIMNNSNYRPKKAKESPFISYQQSPLPDCPVLDSVEKGQNIVVKYRIPHYTEKEIIQETNITIMVHDK